MEATDGKDLTNMLRGGDKPVREEIVSEKKTIWVTSKSQLDFDVEIAIGQATHSSHLYLRALQRNGGLIYASPVFVTVK